MMRPLFPDSRLITGGKPPAWLAYKSLTSRRPEAGFTLVEVLVALVAFTLVAVSISQVSSQHIHAANYLEEKTLATWVAENKLNNLRLYQSISGAPVPAGRSTEEVEMALRRWHISTQIQPARAQVEGIMQLTIDVALESDKKNPIASLEAFMGAH